MKNTHFVLRGLIIAGLLAATSPFVAEAGPTRPFEYGFQLITPNGGETWVSDDGDELIQLTIPTDQRYRITHYLIPQGATPIVTSPMPFNKEFGGYNLGGFSPAWPSVYVTDYVNIEEGMPSGAYTIRSYLTTYKEGRPTGPEDYIRVDESDAWFTLVAPQPAPVMDIGVFNTEAVSPVYGDEDRADYTIEFYIEADDHDIYLPKTAQRDATPDGSSGFEYVIGQNAVGSTTVYAAGITETAISAESSTAGDTPTHFKIAEGAMREFRFDASLNNAGAVAGFYDLRVLGISVLVDLATTTTTITGGLEEFETEYVFVDDEDAATISTIAKIQSVTFEEKDATSDGSESKIEIESESKSL